jgi:hypothetical protein
MVIAEVGDVQFRKGDDPGPSRKQLGEDGSN